MASPGTALRVARFPEDADEVRRLFLAYAAALDIDLCFQGFAEELAALPGHYAEPAGTVLLAAMGGASVGCVALRPLAAGRCEMKRLYVEPGAQGLGLGRKLVEAVLGQARTRGYRSMRLDTLPSMVSALALYRSFGFEPISPYRHNPVPGAIYLEKRLDST
jgi:putative acetyltransferase